VTPSLELIEPDWPPPPRVHAVVTTRAGGVSRAPYETFNLARHVGDENDAVSENRRRLRAALRLPAEPAWLEQVHGARVAVLPGSETRAADAAVAFAPGAVCAILVADCLPVFLASEEGDRVGLAHAGWRGLAAGVVEATIAALDCDPRSLVAWLGPSIGPQAFEVGDEVRAAFVSQDPAAASHFRSGRAGRFFAHLPGLAKRRLASAGVRSVHGGHHCTVSDPNRFFSYRRDGVTGRMAALLWID
jgi:YfiH family protein